MSTKKTILALIITFILSNVLTTVWYMLTDEANFVPYRRAETNYMALMLNHLVYVALLVYLFPFYYNKAATKARAFLYGCLIATLMYIPQAMVIRAIWKVDFNSIFVFNSLAHIVIGGILGLAVAFVYDFRRQAG